MIWAPSGTTFLLDGKPYYSTSWSPSQPMTFVLSMSTGSFWDGTPDVSTPFPVSLDIQSITVRSL
jgi:hypothetical protein